MTPINSTLPIASKHCNHELHDLRLGIGYVACLACRERWSVDKSTAFLFRRMFADVSTLKARVDEMSENLAAMHTKKIGNLMHCNVDVADPYDRTKPHSIIPVYGADVAELRRQAAIVLWALAWKIDPEFGSFRIGMESCNNSHLLEPYNMDDAWKAFEQAPPDDMRAEVLDLVEWFDDKDMFQTSDDWVDDPRPLINA